MLSFVVNGLLFTGPIYMVQVYDRVLGSRSEGTLLPLTTIIIFIFIIMGLLDFLRGRILARVGARLQTDLDCVVRPGQFRDEPSPVDVEAVRRTLAAPGFIAVFDCMWVPLLLAGLYVFHPWMGRLALVGGVTLVLLGVINRWATARARNQAQAERHAVHRFERHLEHQPSTLQALGMGHSLTACWGEARRRALSFEITVADRNGAIASASKTLRLLLQSLMLGLGAMLVLREEVSPGIMIASSILLARALAPLEQIAMQWDLFERGLAGWRAIRSFDPVPRSSSCPPVPVKATLRIQGLSWAPDDGIVPVLRNVSFSLEPGQACGVIGPGVSGKTALLRLIAGSETGALGTLMFGDVHLEDMPPEVRSKTVGYVPQSPVLLAGSIADNIAGFDPDRDDARVQDAAKRVGLSEALDNVLDGFERPVSTLSGGQAQLLALARALYHRPPLLVLDEPNAHLDHEGAKNLNAVIHAHKAGGGAVLLAAHRPSAIDACDLLLRLDAGHVVAFGPKEHVLRGLIARRMDEAKAA